MKGAMLGLAVTLLMSVPPLHAQDADAVVFTQYYRCTQGDEGRADEIAREVFVPVIQRHIDAGDLTGMGWLAHVQGGAWRRALFTLGTDLAQMMEVRERTVSEITEDHPEALAELGRICPGHDDYIWTAVSTSPPDPEALGTASISSYHMCERGEEARADEIFEEVLAPLYRQHTEAGDLASWGWYAHRSGGLFRRLETMSGADHLSLLNIQAAIYGEADPEAMEELLGICEMHTDYMWDNITQP